MDANTLPYEFDGNRGYCKVCKIELTSRQHATQQHLNGKVHKNKISQSQSTTLFCAMCEVPFSSQGNYEEHKVSARHIKKEHDAKRLNDTQKETVYHGGVNTPVSISDSGSETSSWQTCQQSLASLNENYITVPNDVNTLFDMGPFESPGSNLFENMSRQEDGRSLETELKKTCQTDSIVGGLQQLYLSQSIRGGVQDDTKCAKEDVEYTFDGNQEYCNVCCINLTSHQHAFQHYEGKPHKKARQRQQVGASCTNNEFGRFCKVCQVSLTSLEHEEQHIAGSKHQKALGILTRFGGANHLELSEGKHHKKAIENLPYTKHEGLYCDVCHVPFSGIESKMQHDVSAKHLKNVAMLSKDTDSGLKVIENCKHLPYTKHDGLYCDFGKVPFSGIESKIQHEESAKPLKNVAVLSKDADFDNETKILFPKCDIPNLNINISFHNLYTGNSSKSDAVSMNGKPNDVLLAIKTSKGKQEKETDPLGYVVPEITDTAMSRILADGSSVPNPGLRPPNLQRTSNRTNTQAHQNRSLLDLAADQQDDDFNNHNQKVQLPTRYDEHKANKVDDDRSDTESLLSFRTDFDADILDSIGDTKKNPVQHE